MRPVRVNLESVREPCGEAALECAYEVPLGAERRRMAEKVRIETHSGSECEVMWYLGALGKAVLALRWYRTPKRRVRSSALGAWGTGQSPAASLPGSPRRRARFTRTGR